MKIEYYKSTEDMPIKRFHRFNKYLMKSSDVGSTFEDVSAHLQKLAGYIKHDLKTQAAAQISNLEQSIFNLFNEIDPRGMAHAVMIKTVDGEPQMDISEEALSILSDRVGEAITKKELDVVTEDLKKNSNSN